MKRFVAFLMFGCINASVVAQRTTEDVLFALEIAEKASQNNLAPLSIKLTQEALAFGAPTVSSTPESDGYPEKGVRVDVTKAVDSTAIQDCRRSIRNTVLKLINEWKQAGLRDEQIATVLAQIIFPKARPNTIQCYEDQQSDWQQQSLGLGHQLLALRPLPSSLKSLIAEQKNQSIGHACFHLLLNHREPDRLQTIERFAKSGITESEARLVAATASAGTWLPDAIRARLCQISGIRQSNARELLLQSARLYRRSGQPEKFRDTLQQFLKYSPGSLVAEKLAKEEFAAAAVSDADIKTFFTKDPEPVAVVVENLNLNPDPADANPDNIWLFKYDLKRNQSTLLAELPEFRFARTLDVNQASNTAVFAATKAGRSVTSGQEIYSLSLDNGQLKRIADGAIPQWSPQGQRIVFCRYRPTPGIWIYSSQDDRLTQVDSTGWTPTWSPEGNQIAWTVGRNPTLVSILNLVEQQITTKPWPGGQNSTVDDVRFNKDGRLLVISHASDRQEPATLNQLSISDWKQSNLHQDINLQGRPQGAMGTIYVVKKNNRFLPEQIHRLDIAAQALTALPGQPQKRRNLSLSLTDNDTLYFLSVPSSP